MYRKNLLFLPIVFVPLNLAGCTAMLPSAHEVVRTPWNSFQEIQKHTIRSLATKRPSGSSKSSALISIRPPTSEI